jgi:transcription initiation factor TFIID subunit TAF12
VFGLRVFFGVKHNRSHLEMDSYLFRNIYLLSQQSREILNVEFTQIQQNKIQILSWSTILLIEKCNFIESLSKNKYALIVIIGHFIKMSRL